MGGLIILIWGFMMVGEVGFCRMKSILMQRYQENLFRWWFVMLFINSVFFGLFIYGFSIRELRFFLWEELGVWNRCMYSLQKFIGDFNVLFEFKDR